MGCVKCGAELSSLDTALHRKLINRGSTEFMCIKCLSKYFNVAESRLLEKAEEFKKSGCTLFTDKK